MAWARRSRRKSGQNTGLTQSIFSPFTPSGVTVGRRCVTRTGRARPTLVPFSLPLLILLAGAPWAAAAEEILDAQALYQKWTQVYGLEDRFPPRNLSLKGVPEGTHLQRCWKRTEMQEKLETRGPQGEPPSWTQTEPGCSTCVPHTPWVQGSDYDNLPGTHVAQRDIWLHQFPEGDCSDRKFFVVMWPTAKIWGIGAGLTMMSAALDLAMEYNRTLVAYPKYYGRAGHAACKEFGEFQDFSCYFARFTTKSCEAAVKAILRNERRDTVRARGMSLHPDLAGNTQAVVVSPSFGWGSHFRTANKVAERWGQPWLRSGELQWAVVRRYGDKEKQAAMLKDHWWRSQAVRFLLRWPSAYLCHLENKARHAAYGALMAEGVVESIREQEQIRTRVEQADARANAEHDALARVNRSMGGWRPSPDLGLVHDPSMGVLKYGEQEERYMFPEPLMPRPIVSVHVRQGDKGIEQRLFSFDAFMFQAAKLRAHVPYLKTVWLSTEMQSVVGAIGAYPSWTFYFTNNTRQELGTRVFDYEAQAGMENIVGASFANLLISSQCDSYVSMLNSNWNRLIHQMRSTNGRAHAMLLSLNYGDW